jgi:hypothetical protein
MEETTSFQVYRETRGLRNDRLMTERAVDSEKNRWADKLKGSTGQDIKDVLSGKKKVKLTFSEVVSYKLRFYKNKLRKIIGNNGTDT